MLIGQENKGDWFRTVSGRTMWVNCPRESDIVIEDIACALARICRFGGHVWDFYSVAQHSILVSRLVPREHALVGLMHDTTEAYIGDHIRPIKRTIPALRQLEDVWWMAIACRFGLPLVIPACVKQADRVALITERRDLRPDEYADWTEDRDGIEPDPATIIQLPHHLAETAFLQRFEELSGG